MQKKVIYGPPGTGKTTYLMKLLEEELVKTPSSQIAFVSFTKQGTYEGAKRAKKKFDLSDDDLQFFRTIHSLCFKSLGASRADMITKQHYRLLSTTTGINFTGYYTEDFSSANDAYLHVASMEKHNKNLAFRLLNQLNEKRYKYIQFQYGELKRQLGIRDFDDLLVEYLETGEPLPVKVAFVDEAQDLTKLQWRVVRKMFSNVEKIYVAGDDDQAVYEWSGADVNSFLRFSKDAVVLNHSYRMPKKILDLSRRITRDIAVRQKKKFTANGTEGELAFESAIKNVEWNGGELVLARTNWILRQLSFDAVRAGVLFKLKGKLSIDRSVIKAIHAYDSYRQKADNEILKYTHQFNLLSKQVPWQDVIILPSHEIAYYEKLLATGGLKKPPVEFETYHSCKGSENDHVVLAYDLTKNVQENFLNNRDAELRCLYVGMTRAKTKLTLLAPSSKEHYPEKYFS